MKNEKITFEGLVDKENVKRYTMWNTMDSTRIRPKMEKNNITDGLIIAGPDEENKGHLMKIKCVQLGT